MKRLIIYLLALLTIAVSSVAHAAQVDSWDSYSDAACTVQCDDFNQYGNLVYMKATGLPVPDEEYEVRYYDAADELRQSETGIMSSNGELLSQILPSNFEGSAVAGKWYAELWNEPPATKPLATAKFNVQESAIPEFPTVASGIGVAVLCGVIFLWMRKRAK